MQELAGYFQEKRQSRKQFSSKSLSASQRAESPATCKYTQEFRKQRPALCGSYIIKHATGHTFGLCSEYRTASLKRNTCQSRKILVRNKYKPKAYLSTCAAPCTRLLYWPCGYHHEEHRQLDSEQRFCGA